MKNILRGLVAFVAVAAALIAGAQPAVAIGGAWNPFSACATGSISSVSVDAAGHAVLRGTVTPSCTVPPGGYFAVAEYSGVIIQGVVAAKVLYDAGPSTYYEVPLDVYDGARACIAWNYTSRMACVSFHKSGSTWTVTTLAVTDRLVSGTITESSIVDGVPKCGICWITGA